MTRPSNIDSEKLLQLAVALQTTLDVESLIGIFGQHLATLVSHQGLQYTDQQAGIDVTTGQTIGETGQDRSDYPLILEERPLGHLGVLSAGPLSASQKNTVKTLIAGLLHPLRNALMYREAVNASARDPLTGVNNRSRFREVLDREVELSRRHGIPLSLIMLDVDRFKSINDAHGHLAGDVALKSIADCTLSCIRDSDILFRYGGEEFCIALANTSLSGARKLAERVRRALEILVVRASGTRLHVTASFGVATLGKEDDAAHLVEKADHSLYRAKALGRNRIATHEDGDAQALPVKPR
ncbi:MAG: GGDEF domain-containing protein [Gammaproteobacteria bacterium]|nr:MAG: GGDEF domain-containing protein [Gammaproteobacteria bacterium]